MLEKDFVLLGVYVNGWMAREIIGLEPITKKVSYRDYVLKSGAAVSSKSCSLSSMTGWAEREATPEESALLDRQEQINHAKVKEEKRARFIREHPRMRVQL